MAALRIFWRAKASRLRRCRPSNCGFRVAWSDHLRARFEGQPLKPVALSFGGQRVRGEAVITRDGLEGGAVYALSPLLREAIDASGAAELIVDLLPEMDEEAATRRLSAPRGKQSLSNVLRKTLSLSPAAIGLAQEVTNGKLGALAPDAMAAFLKAVPVTLTGVAPIERAISTAGGVTFDAIDDAFMLKQKPGVFVAGEMLDWEAPTGGYLLQACFATGVAAGEGALRYLASSKAAHRMTDLAAYAGLFAVAFVAATILPGAFRSGAGRPADDRQVLAAVC